MSKNMIDHVIEKYDALAASWVAEADRRQELWPEDPLVNAYYRCAVEQRKLGGMLHDDLDVVTTEQYAELNRVTVQTVRRWCSSGQLAHFEDARGILIKRHAKRDPEMRGDS